MRKLGIASLALAATCFFSPFASAIQTQQQFLNPDFKEQRAFPKKLHIMEYNVENLFDTTHDHGKNDWEFTPKNTAGKNEFCDTEPQKYQKKCRESDWTEEKLEIKIGQIAKVIAKASSQPDLLALVEVENEAVVRRLADRIGYKSLLITDSPDARGVDVALLFNESNSLRLQNSRYETVDLEAHGGKPSRDILIAEFIYGLKNPRKLAVMVNHWPSQNNKTSHRQLFADRARDLSRAYIKRGFDVVVTGDFNVEPVNDHPNPLLAFENLNETVLLDVDRIVRQNAQSLKIDASELPPGTYFFWNEGYESRPAAMTWNTLDRFFVSPSLLQRADFKSYRILNHPEFTTTVYLKNGPMAGSRINGVPKRYSHASSSEETSGFSDHFAIEFSIGYD